MRIHVLGLPHTQTNENFTSCAFTQKALNLCKMLHRRGHEVIHYGVEGSSPECTENVSVMPEDTWRTTIGGHPGTNFYNTKVDGPLAPYHDLFARNMHAALASRVAPTCTEIVCQTWGGAQRTACEGIDQFLVESGIGYPHSWAEWRVYESYAWLHMHLGRDNLFGGKKWYWGVIPNAFDLKNFTPADKRGDELLYLGRLQEDKGVAIAIAVAKEVGRKIRIVGQGDPTPFLRDNPHAIYQPPVGIEDRRKLYAEAYAVFCPTQYVEPFGGVHVEAMMSGTPVITTDFGVFPETVLHGVTGYRCRSFEQFVWAAKNIDRIDGRVCAEWARANFSLERVALMYEEFFQQILNLRDFHKTAHPPTGFYERFPERTQLDWLVRKYPKAVAEPTIDLTRPHLAPTPPTEPPPDAWSVAQKFETDWWGLDWNRRWDEEILKQRVYCRLIGIDRSNFGNREILDVGCGPVSLLQRTEHGPSRGVDPLPMSDATKERYRKANVEVLSMPAETMPVDRKFDEVWMYNCLQHTRDPREILQRIEAVSKAGTSVRIFEWLDTDPNDPGHPQMLTEHLFADYFTSPRWKRGIWNVGSISEGLAEGRYIAIVAHAVS
jgi:hypothetical protein